MSDAERAVYDAARRAIRIQRDIQIRWFKEGRKVEAEAVNEPINAMKAAFRAEEPAEDGVTVLRHAVDVLNEQHGQLDLAARTILAALPKMLDTFDALQQGLEDLDEGAAVPVAPLRELVTRWRGQAAWAREQGGEAVAEQIEQSADELEALLTRHGGQG